MEKENYTEAIREAVSKIIGKEVKSFIFIANVDRTVQLIKDSNLNTTSHLIAILNANHNEELATKILEGSLKD